MRRAAVKQVIAIQGTASAFPPGPWRHAPRWEDAVSAIARYALKERCSPRIARAL
jgi:hypothetical protein